MAYKGIWKNVRAFGLARRLVWGVSWSDCLFQLSPKSFPVSGWKGRSMGLIEAEENIGFREQERSREETYQILEGTSQFDSAGRSCLPAFQESQQIKGSPDVYSRIPWE